ncbi:MAG: ImmA/IrrE family metallo-endopeptidase [Oscillospiraceae bacterium]|nr:ImmA/IrrE family metallo-endopeptidase [Oscillospiraceae bacterium]
MSIIDRIIKANGICKTDIPPFLRGKLTATGCATKLGQEYYIFLAPANNTMGTEFTVAHELGHILLGHLDNPPIAGGGIDAEMEANVFASVLLAFSQIAKIEGTA